MSRILVVEDGTEYTDVFRRFLADRFAFERAGSGPEALRRLAGGDRVDALFLDMCFDRVAPEALLGDVDAVAEAQFDGDLLAARRHVEEHQGLYVLAAIRAAGHRMPALISHDFSAEPRRLERLRAAHGPLDALPDVLRPAEVSARLERLLQPS
jgi:CheY-like chemotaxis protein